MCSYCSSPTQTVASKKRAVISRMFPAFIITAPYGSPKTESVLNLLGNCLLPLPDEASVSPASQAKQNMVFAATGRVRKVKRETSKFSHSMGVLARSDIPQSQHRQLNLIHKFDHPCALKRNLDGARATFQFHEFMLLILILSLQLDMVYFDYYYP